MKAKTRYHASGYDSTGLRYLGIFTGTGDLEVSNAVSSCYPTLPHIWLIAERRGEPNRVIAVRGQNPFNV